MLPTLVQGSPIDNIAFIYLPLTIEVVTAFITSAEQRAIAMHSSQCCADSRQQLAHIANLQHCQCTWRAATQQPDLSHG